ncbi:MAG: DUF5625 family protein [Deltaproteobacteria bacterium]|nr:DUF5625 family protein [Deltaproteobacteria bacterium]
MKRILTIIMIILACLAGCRAAGPRPPIELPFVIHQAGTSVSTELRILEEREYPFMLKFMFRANDKADHERVRKLVGEYQKDRQGYFMKPGIQTPLKVTINVIDSSGERLFLEKEYMTMGMYSGPAANFYDRKIDFIKLTPGLYRVTVQSLKSTPELMNTEVILGIYSRQHGKI